MKLRVLLGVFFIMGQQVEAQQQITAEWVETRLQEAVTERTYSGRVAFVDSLEGLRISADTAVVRGDEYLFASNLVFKDATRLVEADSLNYNDKSRIARFAGHVWFKDPKQSLKANLVDFHPDSDFVVAAGEVAFVSDARKQDIRADGLRYLIDMERGQAFGAVHGQLVGELNDTLHIQTDSLVFSANPETFNYVGTSKVSQSNMILGSRLGYFDGEVLRALQTPEVHWRQTAQVDSIRGTADTIDIHTLRKKINAVDLYSAVNLHRVGTRDSVTFKQTITGERANLNIEGDHISKISVFHQIQMDFTRSSVHVVIQGDSMFAWFDAGKLDSLEVLGTSKGVFQATDKGNGSVSGARQTLWFEDNELVKMRVVGNAVCTYLNLNKEDKNQVDVGGNMLVIYFDQGDVKKIDAQGQVAGVYVQDKGGK